MEAWQCGLNPFKSLEEVPTHCQEKWARAMATILRRIQEAQSEEELDRGLKGFLLSPQLLLREPRRGGRKGQSSNEVSARFDCVVREDWGTLLSRLRADKEAVRVREENRRENRQRDDVTCAKDKLRKKVLHLLARGQISRAVRLICSNAG